MRAWIVILVLCVLKSASASKGVDGIELDRVYSKRSGGYKGEQTDFLKLFCKYPAFETLYVDGLGGYTNSTYRRTRTSSHIIYRTDSVFPTVSISNSPVPVEVLCELDDTFSSFSMPYVLSGQAAGGKYRPKVYTYDKAKSKSTLPVEYFRALYRKACALLGMNEPLRYTRGLPVNTKEGLRILNRIVGYKIPQEEIERTSCHNFRQLQIGARMTLLEAEVKRAEALSGIDREYLVVIGEGLNLVESIDVLAKFSTNDIPNDILLSNYSRSYKHLQEKARSDIKKIKLHYHETLATISQGLEDFTLSAALDKIIQLAKSPDCVKLNDSFIDQICVLLTQRIQMLEKNLTFICEVNAMKPQDVIEYILKSDYRECLKEDQFYQVFFDEHCSPRSSESAEDVVHLPQLNFLSYEHLFTEGLLEEFSPLEAKIVQHRKFKENQISDGDACNADVCDASCDVKKDD